jgi:hypothetical protein
LGEFCVQKIVIATVLLVAWPVLLAQQTFTNESVIKMVQMGFSDSAIIDAISRNPGSYDTSIDSLLTLKKAGIDNNVLQAMIHKETAPVSLAPRVAPAAMTSGTSPDLPKSSPGAISTSQLMLREGTDVPLTFAEDVSSKTASDGDPVVLLLDGDLKVGNVVVAKAGSKAFGEITNAQKSGMLGKAGQLNMRLNYLKVGENKIRLRGAKGKEGESGTTGVVVLTVLFGPLGLIKHGKNIEIKQGTTLTAYVADDIALPAVLPQ